MSLCACLCVSVCIILEASYQHERNRKTVHQEAWTVNMKKRKWHQQALIRTTSALKSNDYHLPPALKTKDEAHNQSQSTMTIEFNLVPFSDSPPLVHLCVSSVVLSRTPAVAAKRRQGADAIPKETWTPWHLCNSIFGLFFSFSHNPSSPTTTTVQSCTDSSSGLNALHWAPAAFQALAALETGAGRTNTGCVVCGGTGDGNLAGAISSCY